MCAVLFTGVVSGCENTKVQVENLINMNAQFKGSRSITVNTGFVFEGKEDLKAQFDEAVKEFCPSAFKREVKNADDGLKYIFTIEFDSKEDYINKISSVLDRQAGAALGTPDSDLARGWHLKEDFDGMELIKWLQDGIAEKSTMTSILNTKALLISLTSAGISKAASQAKSISIRWRATPLPPFRLKRLITKRQLRQAFYALCTAVHL